MWEMSRGVIMCNHVEINTLGRQSGGKQPYSRGGASANYCWGCKEDITRFARQTPDVVCSHLSAPYGCFQRNFIYKAFISNKFS